MGTLLRKIASLVAGSAMLATSALVIAPATAQAATAPCRGKTAACIDLSAQRAWIMDKRGHVTYGPVRVTTGRRGYETPPGSFRVIWKDIDHWSRAYNAPMPYSVFFTNTGIAFHEGSLSVKSHGCVHLSHAAAKMFYRWLAPGNVVTVVR
jgi:lipoprotein-anchoring transpeptidase ErfK/SrfK